MVMEFWNSGTTVDREAMLRDILEEVALTRHEIGKTALKQRLEALGSRVKRSELLRTGPLVLLAMNDDQLKRAVALAGVVEPRSLSQQAA